MSYLIFSDVSIDVDRDFAQSHDLRYVPMEYVLGDDTFYCNRPEDDEMMHNYYDKLRQKVRTQTSQITPSHYRDIFEPIVKDGQQAIHMSQLFWQLKNSGKIMTMLILKLLILTAPQAEWDFWQNLHSPIWKPE